jgi:hypothetical protein
MEMEARTIPLPERSSYNVIRPVDDLWLWWTLANVLSYLIHEIPLMFFGSAPIPLLSLQVTASVSSVVSLVLITLVLNRYLGNFSWMHWVVATAVGTTIAFVIGALLRSSFYDAATRDISENGAPNLLAYAIVLPVIGALTSGLIVALAQWRVLGGYTGGRGQVIWALANTIPLLLGGVLGVVVADLTAQAYIRVLSGLVIAALIAGSVGYTLMRLLRSYAIVTTATVRQDPQGGAEA